MNEMENARFAVEGWRLGQTSARYESDGQGAAVISTGKGDHGGVSYGEYQLSTRMGTLDEYLRQSRYGKQFLGLTPATPEFDAKWRELARNDPNFAKDQHDFIGKSHYSEQIKCLRAQGIDLSGRGRAVQDVIWSTSVQFRGLTSKIVSRGLADKFGEGFDLSKLADSDIVRAVQDYKITHNASLFKSSPSWQPGLLKRANVEKAALLELASQEANLTTREVGGERQAPVPDRSNVVQDEAFLPRATESPRGLGGAHESKLQGVLGRLGYLGLHGKPLEPDNHLGPNTLHAIKSFQRAHHLHVDGIVGKHTLAALEDAQRWPLLSEATHPQHRLYAQVEEGVRKLPSHGRSGDRDIENAAVALTIAAHTSGLRQVDHVVVGSNGVNLFAVQGRMEDPGHRRVHVELAHAVTHAVDHRSMAISHPAPEHLHGVALAQQQAPPHAPVMAGP